MQQCHSNPQDTSPPWYLKRLLLVFIILLISIAIGLLQFMTLAYKPPPYVWLNILFDVLFVTVISVGMFYIALYQQVPFERSRDRWSDSLLILGFGLLLLHAISHTLTHFLWFTVWMYTVFVSATQIGALLVLLWAFTIWRTNMTRSAQYLGSVLETQREMICRFLPDTTLTFVNGAYARQFGKSPDELVGTSFLALVPEGQHATIIDFIHTLTPENPTATYVHQSIAGDGSLVWQEWTDHVILDDSGHISELQSTGHDITDYKAAQQAVSQSEARLRNIFDSLDAMVYVSDLQNYQILFANRYAKMHFGEVEGHCCWKVLQKGQQQPCEFCPRSSELLDVDGQPAATHRWEIKNTRNGCWYDCRDQAIRWSDGRYVRLQIATDISERKRIEADLLMLHTLQLLLVELATSSINMPLEDVDSAICTALAKIGTFVQADRAYIFAYDNMQKTLINTHQWRVSNEHDALSDKALIIPTAIAKDWIIRHLQGEIIHIPDVSTLTCNNPQRQLLKQQGIASLIAVPMMDDANYVGFCGFDATRVHAYSESEQQLLTIFAQMLLNVRNRQQTEERLKHSEERFRELFMNSPVAILIHDKDTGAILDANPAACAIRGYTSLEDIRQNFWRNPRYQTEYMINSIKKASKSGGQTLEWPNQKRSGERIWELIYLTPLKLDGKTRIIATIIDITQRKQAEEHARMEQMRLQNIIEGTMTGTWEWNLRTGDIIINARWAKILGYELHELSPMSMDAWLEKLHPEDFDKVQTVLQRHALGELPNYDHEARMRHKDGHWVWVHVRGRIIERTPEGIARWMYGTQMDITARKDMEQALKMSQDLVDHVQIGLHVYYLEDPHDDQSLRLVYANPISEELTGIAVEHVLGKTLDENFPVLRQNNIPQRYAEIICTQRIYSFDDVYYTNEDETPSIFSFKVFPLPGQHFGVAFDNITTRKQIELKLHRQERLYRSLVESQHDLIVRVDTENKLTYVNDAYCRVFGQSREELLGNIFTPLVHEDHVASTLAAMEALQHPPHRAYIEQLAHTCSGWRWLAWEDSAILDDHGEIIEIQGVGRDITPLKEAMQKADEANRAKGLFLASMSHEIRTPLNGIIGFAQILARDITLNSQQMEYVQTIHRSSQHLLTLINDILDFSKIEAGGLNLNPSHFRLDTLIDDLNAMFLSRVLAKGLQFDIDCDASVPKFIHADQIRLRQILINLLGNAIKFTEQGHIHLRIWAVDAISTEVDTDHSTHLPSIKLWLEVTDTGPGIALEDQHNIFEAFYQSGIGIRAGGTGLGLPICKRIIEMMGGELILESEAKGGSCFRFSILTHAVQQDVDDDTLYTPRIIGFATGQSALSLLLVDDKADNRALLKALLEPVGFYITEAVNGEEAVAYCRQYQPDAILMDVRMPVMNGIEATRLIKNMDKNRAMPIIAVTAATLEEIKDSLSSADGFDDYVCKPFDADQIFAVLQKYLRVQYRYENERGAIHTPNGKHLTPERLSILPLELTHNMYKAVEIGAIFELRQLIKEAETHDAALAYQLDQLALQYDYETLLELLSGYAIP